MSEMTKPNVGADLVRIHKVITRGLDVTAQKSAAFARDGYPDGSAREGFTGYARALVRSCMAITSPRTTGLSHTSRS